jgi:DNA-binding LytR/AlgR family response regulator
VNALSTPTALIADDEPLLRERLRSHLARLWPELQIVAEARNGREAVELFDLHSPQIVFLDVHMPGLNGIEAARSVARRAEVVFVTAYEQYAVQAFEQGALDYTWSSRSTNSAWPIPCSGSRSARFVRLLPRPHRPRSTGCSTRCQPN